MRESWIPSGRAWLAVAAGGLVGSELRYGLGLAFPDPAGSVPWTTLWINVVGSFVLAALTTSWMARPHTAFWLRAGLGPGLLAVDQLARDGQHMVWIAYLGLSLLLGLLSAALGWRLGKLTGRLSTPDGSGSRQ